MQLFQILSCSDVGTCCGNYAIASLLDIGRRMVSLVQLLVPIVLISSAIFQLVMMLINPDDKKGTKKITNKIIAAVVVFFIPTAFDLSIGVFPDDFSFASCWETAKTMREVSEATKLEYKKVSDVDRKKIVGDSTVYEKGKEKVDTGGSGSSGASGVGAQRMVNTALAELGNNEGDGSHHKYEAFSGLDDSQPWCAAFVTWVGGAAGYLDKNIMPRFTSCDFPNLFSSYGLETHDSSYNPSAGDLIFFTWDCSGFTNHVGIVLSYDSNYIYTIEGNTSCDDSSLNSKCHSSDGVYKKKRPRDCTVEGYATPKYPSS